MVRAPAYLYLLVVMGDQGTVLNIRLKYSPPLAWGGYR